MATISLNDHAPEADSIHFTLGEADFDLKSGGSYETDNTFVVEDAIAHPWLDVKVEVPAPDKQAEVDKNDPQKNPSIDHLSAYATPEAIKKAADENARIQAEHNPNVQGNTEPVEAPAPSAAPTRSFDEAERPSPDPTTPSTGEVTP